MTIDAFVARASYTRVVVLSGDELRRLLASCLELTTSPWEPARPAAVAWFGAVFGWGLIDALGQAAKGLVAKWDRSLILLGWTLEPIHPAGHRSDRPDSTD